MEFRFDVPRLVQGKTPEQKMAICNRCEFKYVTPKGYSKCEKCSCLLSFKTVFPGSTCPVGKW